MFDPTPGARHFRRRPARRDRRSAIVSATRRAACDAVHIVKKPPADPEAYARFVADLRAAARRLLPDKSDT
jgi:hypothetical protein